MRFAFSIVLFFILFANCNQTPTSSKAELEEPITWSGHVAQIIFTNCTPCHRPGESGSFNLLTYSDAVKKAKLIKFVTQTRYMPPWPADANYSHFIGERVLSPQEINHIKHWVEGGTPRGDSLNEPNSPIYYKGSYFRKPDFVLRAPKPVLVKGNGTDAFLILKFPYELSNDTLLDFVEFVPHHRKLVHHVNGHLVSYDAKRAFNYQSGESVSEDELAKLVDVYNKMHIPYTDTKQPRFPLLTSNTVYYLPGYVPPVYPEEIGGYKLNKHGLFLLNNIHYGPSNKAVIDSSYLNVFFRKSKLQRSVYETQLGTFGISTIEPEFIIPPNTVKTFKTKSTLQKNISLLSVNPHMHLIGESFWAFAIKPSGDTIPLIKINKWDFRWQYYYTYQHPIKLEAGTTIYAYGTFNNTIKNPNNPFHPPQTITQGNGVESMKTTEEMFQFIFSYMLYKEGDEKINLSP